MKTLTAGRTVAALALMCGVLAHGSARAAEGAEGITAVSSQVAKDYARARLPDGSFKPEFYAFGEGGDYGGPYPDPTIDEMSFMDIASTIAVPLAGQKFLPAKDPKKTSLLIMVYWGTTIVPMPLDSGGPVNNTYRDHTDYLNAAMLGYDSEGVIGTEFGDAIRLTALRWHQHDLVNEIETNRYFVVLLAYDFQLLWKQKKHKLLWETRFSINQPRNDFGKALPAMATFAAPYFGQESHGLVRKFIQEGHVEIGDPTLIELLTNPKN